MIQILDGGVDVIYFRYADVLLMHAEALLETKGIAASSEIFAIINQLRDRCGGGRVTEANYTSEDALRTLVRNERRVELAKKVYVSLISVVGKWQRKQLQFPVKE